jgi:predicted DNA-binding transcriptional regulator AlpA
VSALISGTEICRRLGISDETWRRWRAAGKAPAPIGLPGRPRWRVSDIDAFTQQAVPVRPSHRRYFAAARVVRHARTLTAVHAVTKGGNL